MRVRLTALACLLLTGCYESFVRSDLDPDGGIVIVLDGATVDAGRDAGRDGGRDAGPRIDAPFDAPPASVCARGEVVPEYTGPGCGPDTTECLEDCEDSPDPGGCQDLCLAGDPECIRCANQRIVTCLNRLSCQAEWNAFACCTERECPFGGTGIDRLECVNAGVCTVEIEDFTTCASLDIGFCSGEAELCFGR